MFIKPCIPGGGGGGGGKGFKSNALPKLGRLGAGFKITPGQQTMSAQNDHCLHITGNYKNGPGPL